ncbi:MAG TPA: tetratricopeptide repeat protein [Edaphobacter sp.]|uniref:tetratricopeptide repeat protein n=1 Tax=Edaphobacter sp. TaxID=1934404 RepID=UPI002C163199|nr:tetratricopeptide repeat protein [Edaphobacter sp.]HUZ93522.1 tetratricopeptide repeat protein [Edaphobacter sp.]
MQIKPFIQRGLLLVVTLVMPVVWSAGQTTMAADSHRDAAIELEQQGNHSGAETEWRTFLKVHPDSAEAYAHLGFLEARQQHYVEAVPLYRKALALDPTMPGLRMNMGLSFFKSGDLKEAIQTFVPLLKSQPPSSPEVLNLNVLIGMAHYGLGEYAEAVPYLKEATSRDPKTLQLRLALVQSCLASKQYQCVLKVYREILMLNAESAEADMLAGEALDELKDIPGAVQQFRAAIKVSPKEPNVHFGLGYLLWKLDRYEDAAQEFKAELANDPNHVLALAYLGDVEMKLQNPKAALPLLEKVIRIDSKVELAHLDLGILYFDANRQDDALRELMTAGKLNPKDVSVHWRLARLYQTMGKKDEAKTEFDETRDLHKTADEPVFDKLHDASGIGTSTK